MTAHGFTTRDIADLLALSPAQIRSFAREGFLSGEKNARGEYWFSFQDVVLLRAAKELTAARISPRRIRQALHLLVAQLPAGRPLSAVRISAVGDEVTVHDAGVAWHPVSGQTTFDFGTAELADGLVPAAERLVRRAVATQTLSAQEWFDLGLDLDAVDEHRAREAYEQALANDPHHCDANVNLGRLLQEAGDTAGAEQHYLRAIGVDGAHSTAQYNLGTLLEDKGDYEGAVSAYESAVAGDDAFRDAHFNLGRLCESLGQRDKALQHLRRYQQLMNG